MSSNNQDLMRFVRYPIGSLVKQERNVQESEDIDIDTRPKSTSLFLCRPYSQPLSSFDKDGSERGNL